MPEIPYTCSGRELPGNANIYENGVKINTINASRCFCDWYCTSNNYTWDWRDGIDPDDETTWPGYEPPEDPPVDPDPV